MGRKKKSALKVEVEAAGSNAPAESAGRAPLRKKIEKTRIRRKSYTMDLRIHSPTALGYLAIEGIDTAPALVRLARVKGLDLIAVTDYYSGEYVERVIEAAKDTAVTVLPGVVIRCRVQGCDDVNLSCLFPEDNGREEIEAFLAELGVPAGSFGDSAFLVCLPFEEILEVVDRFAAIPIPSRMDKTPSGRLAIKTLVEDYGFRAFDLAYFPDSQNYFAEHWPKEKFQFLSFSNAHALAQVGSRHSKIKMAHPGYEGLRTVIDRIVL